MAGVRARALEAARQAEEWIARREREIEEMEARRAELAASGEAARARLAEQLREEDGAREAADRARDAFEASAGDVRGREDELRQLRTEGFARRERVQATGLAVRECGLRLEQVEQRARDRWQVELATWTPPAPGEPVAVASEPAGLDADAGEGDGGEGDPETPEPIGLSRSDAEWATRPREERVRHLEEVGKRIHALGEVNIGAIEEHEELAERQRFLAEQKADLENTVAQLREAIARINRASRKRFRETFEAVDERFRQNFPRLFRGGKANLALTETEDVLDAGVDIVAQPPGKRLQNVNLLSGGEKTLTALALLVSLFQVHPSPFFLLDEVDAALDDANVGRFNEIVREMSAQSQFLVITHNKSTIEIADVLYGVTMEEKGVSKVVSVQLRDG